MSTILQSIVDEMLDVAEEPDGQDRVEAILRSAMADDDVAEAIAARTGLASLEDMAIHRSDALTVLATTIPPGFVAAPHNHNIWSVVGVAKGREDNEFYEREGDGLVKVGAQSVDAPGVLANPADVIHAIANNTDEPLVVMHAYGGDLFRTPRSNWDPDTHEELPFDWESVSSASND